MGKIAFIFSGQGAQYSGMGKEMYENFEECREVFDRANKAIDIDIKNMCFEGEESELSKTENTQPCIVTTSIAMLKALESQDIQPDVVAGLSLGEYSALVCSEAIKLEEAVRLVNKRGKFMQEAVPEGVGTMAAILGLSQEEVREVCTQTSEVGIVEPANFNCPGQVVIGGEIEAVEKACEKALEKGAKRAMRLKVSAPFHTSMLKSAADKLYEEMKELEVSGLRYPLITNVTAGYVEKEEEVKDLLRDQVMNPVLWEDTIKKMIEDGVDTFVELGPGKALSGFVKKVNRKLNIYNIEDMASYQKTVDALRR